MYVHVPLIHTVEISSVSPFLCLFFDISVNFVAVFRVVQILFKLFHYYY